jgi:HAD superfamily hydrolase (TIGR01450 family)
MKTKAVVFDMDGVLRIGNKLIENVENVLQNLTDKNIKTMVVTNECRYTVEELKEELEDLGLVIPRTCVFYTAAHSARDFLEKKILNFPKKQILLGVVGELGLFNAINTLTKYDNVELRTGSLDKEESQQKRLYLVIGTVNKIKISHLQKILKWIKHGAKIITTCKDNCDPSSRGDLIVGMPNHMLHMVGFNIKSNGYSTGKPHPIFKEKIMKLINNGKSELTKIKEKEVLFVGDTIYTDIQLAEESGFKSCLVLSGNSNKDTPKSFVTEPNYILDDVTKLHEIL